MYYMYIHVCALVSRENPGLGSALGIYRAWEAADGGSLNVALLRHLWPLFDGLWDVLKCSSGVLV